MAIYTTDGSIADVNAKLDTAVIGDVVEVPGGSFTWSSPVVGYNKGVHLRGGGSGRIKAWSRSSVAFGTGTKVFTVQSGASIPNGTTVRIWEMATPKTGEYMLGTVTSIVGTTLTVEVTTNTGAGTETLWLIATEFVTQVVYNAGAATLIPITEDPLWHAQVSGIQFTILAGTGKLITWNYTANGRPIFIHDCWFYMTNSNLAIETPSTNRGVIWNCSVNWSYFAESNSQFLHLPINQRTEAWATPSTMGMADTTGTSNIYVEDCDFHGGMTISDFDSNSKVVWRNNVMDHAGVGGHGYDTSPFGARHSEIYDCKFLYADVGADSLNVNSWIMHRGGTGVITDNYFEDINSVGAWGDHPEFQFGVYALAVWGQAPGHWSGDDGNVVEHPAPRQFGLGYVTGTGLDGQGNSVSNGVYVGDPEPLYIWNNTGFTPAISITTDDGGVADPDDPHDYIREGIEYRLEAKPGYTKFTSPHPLRANENEPPPLTVPVFTTDSTLSGTAQVTQTVTLTIGDFTGNETPEILDVKVFSCPP